MYKKIILDDIITNYSVDTEGNVKNDITGYVLNPSIQQGYKFVGLTVNGKTKRCRVHRLVAMAFIPNPENKPYVNHIDGCRSNNQVENLEWVTPKENTQHAVNTGLMKPTREKAVVQYDLQGNKIAEFCSVSEAARQTNSSAEKISMCCNLLRQTHNMYQWRFKNESSEKLQSIDRPKTVSKAVAQIDPKTGEEVARYKSFREAARAVNGTSSAISRVISGTKQTKTHKGWGWKLVEEIVQ